MTNIAPCVAAAGVVLLGTPLLADPALPPAAATVPSPAAVIAAMPKNIPRPVAPPLDLAIAAARASVQACAAKGAKVSALVTDVEGKPVVLLSGDGAGYRSQLIAQSKAAIVVRWHAASLDVANRAEHDPTLTAAAAADPQIGILRGGGFPIVRGGAMVGAFAVSGGSLGGDLTMDERCAAVGLEMLQKG